MSPPTLWGLVAAIPAIGAEYLYRVIPGPWWTHLYMWVPLQLAIGYGVYRLVTIPQTSLLDAFVVWSFSTLLLRTAVSVFLLGDVLTGRTWVAVGLVCLARIVQTWGKV